jgi:hypothetical protein
MSFGHSQRMPINFHTQNEGGRKIAAQGEQFFACSATVRQNSKIRPSVKIFAKSQKQFRVPVHSSQHRGLM